MKRLVLLFIFSLFISEVFSEDCKCLKYTDEIHKKFQTHIDRSEYSAAINLAKKNIRDKNISCQLAGYDQMVIIFMNQGNIDSAKVYLDKQKPLFKKNGCNQAAELEYNISMAEYYFNKDELEKGVKFCFEAMTIAEKLKNYERQVLLYSHISIAFARMEQYDRQLIYIRKSIPLIEKITDPEAAIDHLKIIAGAYKSSYWRTNNESAVDSVRIYGEEILRRSKAINFYPGIITGYLYYNEYYSILKQLPTSLIYLDSALQVLHENPKIPNIYRYLYQVNFDRSFCYFELKDFAKAAIFADSTIKYALMSGQKNIIASAYQKSYEAHKATGNYAKALQQHELYIAYRDSITNVENTTLITELEQKYDKQQNLKKIREEKQKNDLLQKENDIQDLNNRFLLITILAAVLLIVLLFIILRQRKIKSKQEVMEIEMRLNRSRMNPHFFFNALTSLQGLAVRENDGKKMATKLFQFSGLMRQSLESTYTNFITIEEEISFLQKYLEVSKIRDENLFTYNILCEKEIESENYLVPSMIIQPFAENAIEHGFKKQDRKGELEIVFSRLNNQLLIQVKDNGPGLTTSEKKEEHISRATQITKDRIYLLNQNRKGNYHFEISNRSDTSGVIVKIYLPLQHRNENISHR